MKLTVFQITVSVAVAVFLSQFVHELTHAGFGIIVGAHNVAVHFFAANALEGISGDQVFERVLVEASAVVVNLLVGAFALFLFQRRIMRSMWLSYTVFLTAVFSFALGFGYLMFDGIIYVPGMPGDFRAVLDLFDGNIWLRITIILSGSVGWVWTLFFSAHGAWRFVTDDTERIRTNFKTLMYPYILSSIIVSILAFMTHPLGVDGGIIVAMQYFFGNSVLFTGFFLSSYWLEYRQTA